MYFPPVLIILIPFALFCSYAVWLWGRSAIARANNIAYGGLSEDEWMRQQRQYFEQHVKPLLDRSDAEDYERNTADGNGFDPEHDADNEPDARHEHNVETPTAGALERTPTAPSPTGTLKATVVFPKGVELNVAVACLQVCDRTAEAGTKAVVSSQDMILMQNSGSFTMTLTKVPAFEHYQIAVHVIADRETLDGRDCFVDVRPGDFMTLDAVDVAVAAETETEVTVHLTEVPELFTAPHWTV